MKEVSTIGNGAPTKLEKVTKNVSAKTQVNNKTSLEIKGVDNSPKEYKCSCCENIYTKQQGNFMPSNFEIFKGNGGYITTCKSCTDQLCSQLTEFYSGNEEKAIEHICQMFGLYFNESPLSASKKISVNRSRLSTYSSKVQIKPWIGKTYLDTITERSENIKTVDSVDDIEDITEYSITPKMIKFWGTGYDPKVYPTLQGYYDELLKLCEIKPDIKKQKMMKNLCLLEYQMQINIQAGKDIGTLSNSYKTMFEASGLKNEEVDVNKDSYGTWLSMIEKYTPADYYKDKTKYRDFFGIGEYIERFMFRPLKNLLTGSKEKEKEFWINDNKGGE
jgi:hypothetical protein